MKPEQSKLRQAERTEEAQILHESGATSPRLEFASVEEMLRYDSERNPVPAEVGERLNSTLAAEPKPEKPWYKRIFGS